MHKKTEKMLKERVVALGNAGKPEGLPKLIDATHSPSPHVRRLAASAIGKLAELVDSNTAVSALIPLLHDHFPQVRQYSAKALSIYGSDAYPALNDLRDMAINPAEPSYNTNGAKRAVEIIEEARRIKESRAEHTCQRCGVRMEHDEYIRSQKEFKRSYCNYCFDEVFLERRNFETKVELQKNIRAKDGTTVQSDGERLICDTLDKLAVKYRYDERFRILDGYAIRPDFYLPEYDVYIEYWGMNTADYKIGMLKKQTLYQQQGKKLISIYPKDKPHIYDILKNKLGITT